MLAFGCMRFTKENGKINLEKAEAEILEAMKLGVNYFDTAYIYSGSEEAMGKIFEKITAGSRFTLQINCRII